MHKKIPKEILIELVGRFPNGVSIEEVMLGLDPSFSRRTVQRWLSNLVKDRHLTITGQARARRYKTAPIAGKEEITPHLLSIPLSQMVLDLERKVSQPIELRIPVRYNREFLERYRPNVDFYLPQNLREKLFHLGRSAEGTYPAGTYARQIFHRLLIDLSWNSSRLEGNTYSLLETERLLEKGKAAEGKNLKETQMILNHKAAIEFIILSVEEIGVNRYTILNLHTLLSDNLMGDPAACGRLRTIPVGIAKSVYQPLAFPQVIEECFDLLVQKAHSIQDPIEQAFFLMVHIPYLQPFEDVNKRTSRLAVNIPLIQKNLCPLSFIDVPDTVYVNGLLAVYELNRVELLREVFTWAYERSCSLYSQTRKTIGEPDPFRMKYREAIQRAVRNVVQETMDKSEAIAQIRLLAEIIPSRDKPRFIEIVERELQSLHEGNIARYQLRPKEYASWKRHWL